MFEAIVIVLLIMWVLVINHKKLHSRTLGRDNDCEIDSNLDIEQNHSCGRGRRVFPARGVARFASK